MAIASCVECDTEIEIAGRARLGLKVVCQTCGAKLEVVGTNPVEVDWADESDDDWDDDDGEGDLDDDLGDDDFDDDYADEEDELEEDEDWR